MSRSAMNGRWVFVSAGIAVGIIAAACGGSEVVRENTFDTDGGTIDQGDGAPPIFVNTDSGAGDGSSADDNCPEAAKLVYVTGEGGKLYSFYPPTNKYTLVGPLSCNGSNGLPFSPSHMTVDRQGLAWVESFGALYTASTANASCTAVPGWTQGGPTGDGTTFALTFIKASGGADSTLYMLTDLGEFRTYDTTTNKITKISKPSFASASGDMTSNGDGTPYFLSDTTGHPLYNIDPTTGAIKSTRKNLSTLGVTTQALAFWGGSFYLFFGNKVVQYDPLTDTTKSIGNAPINVTGAGQSTCVPKVAPIN